MQNPRQLYPVLRLGGQHASRLGKRSFRLLQGGIGRAQRLAQIRRGHLIDGLERLPRVGRYALQPDRGLLQGGEHGPNVRDQLGAVVLETSHQGIGARCRRGEVLQHTRKFR